jgi:hypothetical protein
MKKQFSFYDFRSRLKRTGLKSPTLPYKELFIFLCIIYLCKGKLDCIVTKRLPDRIVTYTIHKSSDLFTKSSDASLVKRVEYGDNVESVERSL